jgi:hypothetical protein
MLTHYYNLISLSLEPFDNLSIHSQLFVAKFHLVQLIVELRELSNFLHDVLSHEERGVQRSVVLLDQGLKRKLDQSLLKTDGWALKQKQF